MTVCFNTDVTATGCYFALRVTDFDWSTYLPGVVMFIIIKK